MAGEQSYSDSEMYTCERREGSVIAHMIRTIYLKHTPEKEVVYI